ncbi:helix-turn-helix transcriptional regulator [Aulosira sp. FACHB-615]|uniref:helix-turn-helix domain-containing protein n=1 Tax=Aulosira sp. FACHB-615 TaxID=2692777 RepID=UPI001686ACA7|nr:helix-turn-helix transcriptional regulator [Aulosira sp. FACHB-615]MBD2492526.1 helix-turn-helix transcriptional regulator [Aulosira sp. FACHB-615]
MRELREKQGLRTVDVASRLKIGESTVRNWEKGRTIPKLRVDQLEELLELYGCTFEEFMQSVKLINSKAD